MTPRLDLTRQQVLSFRRRVNALDARLAWGEESLRLAAWAGLQDSMPRAALLSIHARVGGTPSTVLDHASLVQVWGPRFSVFVVAKSDLAVFTLGRLPDSGKKRDLAEDLARRLSDLLGDRSMPFGEAGRALGEPHNRLRYAAPTGTVLLDWDGARQPTIRSVSPPEADPAEARLELARRFLHIYGPATPIDFVSWAGIAKARGTATFAALDGSLTPVRTPIGDAWILSSDEAAFRADAGPAAPARMLPSGDAYYLLQGDQRALLVPNTAHQNDLWTSRVWPGALLVDGEVVGIWRRSKGTVSFRPWRRLSAATRDVIAAEAESLPLPDVEQVSVVWDG